LINLFVLILGVVIGGWVPNVGSTMIIPHMWEKYSKWGE